MTTEKIQQAIEKAERMYSKLQPANFEVPALASLKIRHLLNNIGELGTNYLECGPHKGGSFTSAITRNPNLRYATAIDSFESDVTQGETAKKQFLENTAAFLCAETEFKLIQSDCFATDITQIPKGVDVYLYDAGHSFEDQRDALLYFKEVLADTFIYLCDDWTFERVKEGTMEGIRQGGYEVLFEKELLNTTPGDGHLNDEWWRGYYVALLKKQ